MFVVGVSNLIEKPECGTNGMLNVTQVLASACVLSTYTHIYDSILLEVKY